jgi:tetratricopeptide (TPR) repeat protein
MGQANPADQLLKEADELYRRSRNPNSQTLAIAKFEEAAKLYREARNLKGAATALNNVGAIYSELRQPQKALEYYEQALPLWRANGYQYGEAMTLSNIGKCHGSLGDQKKSLEYYEPALLLWHAMDNLTGAARTLMILGELYNGQNEKRKALECYIKALPLWQVIEDRIKEANTIDLIARRYEELGEKDKAKEYSKKAFDPCPTCKIVSDSESRQPEYPNRLLRSPTIECPDEIGEGQEFAVQVSLTEALLTPEVRIYSGSQSARGFLSLLFDLSGSVGVKEKLDVVLSAPGFSFTRGSNISKVELSQTGDSTSAIFWLRPKRGIPLPSVNTLFVTFLYQDRFLAKVSRQIEVVENKKVQANEQPKSAAANSQHAQIPKVSNENGRTENVELGNSRRSPDLTVIFLSRLNPNQMHEVEIIIDSPYLQPQTAVWSLPKEFHDWLRMNYSKIASAGLRSAVLAGGAAGMNAATKEQTAALMKGFGRELYEKFAPSAFKEAFWQLVSKRGNKFTTIQIYSNDPAIPWELMRPVNADGSFEWGFIGVEFNLGRWHFSQTNSQRDKPPQRLRVEKLIAIAPQYPSGRSLPAQKLELEALAKFRNFQSMRGTYDVLKGIFDEMPQAIIHFAGHGSVSRTANNLNEFSISLEDFELDLMRWRGLARKNSKAHPFFFFNACEIGQAQRVANFVDGWAPAVLEKGASGYIGALWPISDRGAAEFATRFYALLDAELRSGYSSVGEVLRKTRKLYLENGDPSFLAYVYYGDPELAFFTH